MLIIIKVFLGLLSIRYSLLNGFYQLVHLPSKALCLKVNIGLIRKQ